MSAAELPSCDYCGLPVARAARTGRPEKLYCCFGCRFAAAVTQARGEQGAAGWMLARLGLAAFLSMNVMVFAMALWTQDFYGEAGADPGAFAGAFRGLFRYLGLLFALPVLLLLGGPLLENAWANLRRGAPSTDLLLLAGVAASYLYSVVSVLRDQGPVYFEVGCVVLVLVTLGRWLEATGKLRAAAALEGLQRLLPETACVVQGDDETSLPLDQVRPGDCLRVRAGERIPCDGRVLRNTAAVDEQALTGESLPTAKGPGDRVYGGSLNLDGDLYVVATAAARAGLIARMIELVRQAGRQQGRYQRLADRVSAWFLPAVAVIALAVLAWHTSHSGPDQGILGALSVVVIACPCALGLATPMAVWAALGQAARAQVLFRHGEALERLAAVRAIRFDKTGTLTTGDPTVAAFTVNPSDEPAAVLAVASQLAASSTHAYARAVCRFAQSQGMPDTPPTAPADVRTLPGKGLTAMLPSLSGAGSLGSARLMADSGLVLTSALAGVVNQAQDAGCPLTCIGWSGHVRGVFVFREELRPEATEALALLQQQGLDVAVLTGDGAARAASLGRELRVPVTAGLLPEDKVTALAEARCGLGLVAMVGDGINDAPALAAADVGIALGCGADVSRETAAVCLLGNDLLRLPWAVALARRTVRVIKQNLFWAFLYNTAGIALAATGRLGPVPAALAMTVSSLLVVTNSLRFRTAGPPVAPPTLAAKGEEGSSQPARELVSAQPAARAEEAWPWAG
jgi:heavy metal translocating P-type ATPase